MRKKETSYPDSELANRLKIFTRDFLYLSKKEVGQQGNIVYIKYGKKGFEKEYVSIFSTEQKTRKFYFHIEEPENNLIHSLEEELMTDNAVLRKGNIRRYKEIFQRISIGEGHIDYMEKQVPTAFAVTEIKKIPLGRKGHLSENFIKYLFDYNVVPFIYIVQKYAGII